MRAIIQRVTSGRSVKTGRFGADMHVEIHNDGPVTILNDTKIDNPDASVGVLNPPHE